LFVLFPQTGSIKACSVFSVDDIGDKMAAVFKSDAHRLLSEVKQIVYLSLRMAVQLAVKRNAIIFAASLARYIKLAAYAVRHNH
jgi:hypothetical protein